jgi:signal transduction histidine kinase
LGAQIGIGFVVDLNHLYGKCFCMGVFGRTAYASRPLVCHEGIPGSLPKEVSLCLFRVLQEALQNAVKHSGARQFRVELHGTSGEIRLTVIDQGVGFDQQEATNRHGLGLVSMQERTHMVGGEFSIQSEPSRGTTISVCVPLKVEKQENSVASAAG